MIWELALNAAFGMKCIQYYYGIPTGTFVFRGIYVLHILTVDYSFKYRDNSIFWPCLLVFYECSQDHSDCDIWFYIISLGFINVYYFGSNVFFNVILLNIT